MSAQSDYVFARVNKWVFNHGRQASPFYIVVMLVTLLMMAFAEPVSALVAGVIGLIIVGWRDVDHVSSGPPDALFFRTFNEDSLEMTCKYYADTMAAKGISEEAYELDVSMLRYFYHQGDLTWTYFMVVMLQRKASLQITPRTPNEPEDVQQTELPAVPASESDDGIVADPAHRADDGS